MFQLDGIVEGLNLLGFCYFLDVVLGMENLVDALHRSQTLLDAVTCLGEVFDGLQGGVENHKIVDEAAGVDGTVA